MAMCFVGLAVMAVVGGYSFFCASLSRYLHYGSEMISPTPVGIRTQIVMALANSVILLAQVLLSQQPAWMPSHRLVRTDNI